jgi:uncharacterized Tic20 family protein
MNAHKGMRFFKWGAWILVVAGFGHAIAAIPDTFLSGLFSPASPDAIAALKNTSGNIVVWLGGHHTSVFESAWAAYIGFAISVGLLVGFIGLILLLVSRRDSVLNNRYRSILLTAIGMSSMMTAISLLFFFYLPTVLLASSLVCFILAWFNLRKGEHHVA